MNEIERKFLVIPEILWKEISQSGGEIIFQGYLNKDKNRTVRVRTYGAQAFITIKGLTEGITRPEYEYEIPCSDAVDMLQMCDGFIVSKTRHRIDYDGHIWEIDVFHGENEGLIVAEIELKSEDEALIKPPWLGKEVSDDKKYFNSSLSTYPFTRWIWV
jgi:adenylate cyclase